MFLLPARNLPRSFFEGVFLMLSYAAFFWRIFKQNPGNRLIECGCMTVIVFIALIPMTSTTNLPDWLLFAWLLLTTLLCFATLFFFGQRIFRALAHKK